MIVERRSFLKAVLVLVTAPAIVRACNIMPIKNVVLDSRSSKLFIGDETYLVYEEIGTVGGLGVGYSWFPMTGEKMRWIESIKRSDQSSV